MNDITILKTDKFLDEEHVKKIAIVEELVKTPVITEEIKAFYDKETSELRK
jgi:hypothetical protein